MRTRRLPPKLKELVDVIIKQYHPEKIILFGSAASGKLHEDSDVDLAIVKRTSKKPYQRIGDVESLLWDVRGAPATDIVVYTPEEFAALKQYRPLAEEVIGKGVVLYDR
jgi:predicted nucleotidyltransferase